MTYPMLDYKHVNFRLLMKRSGIIDSLLRGESRQDTDPDVIRVMYKYFDPKMFMFHLDRIFTENTEMPGGIYATENFNVCDPGI